MNPNSILSLLLDTSTLSFRYIDYTLIVLTGLLIFVNIFISSSEVAFFSLDKNEIERLKSNVTSKKAQFIESLANTDELLASILVAYNTLNVLIITLLLFLFNKVSFFSDFGIVVFLLLLLIALVLILLVEVLPKLYAFYAPEKVILRNIKGVMLIDALFSPISSFLLRFTDVFNQSSARRKHEISMDDLSKALELTSNEISLEQEKDMLEGIIRFREKNVSDILISRADMFNLNIHNSFYNVITFIVDKGFSRIPVYEDNEDQIRGILYVKDLLPHIGKSDNFKWQTLIRPAYFVPENKRIDELLEEFRTNKNHMAIVVDEYGGTTGIVTMEDILEEIVGDISDEYDEEVPFYTLEPDGSYLFDGKTPLVDFLRVVNIPEKDFHDILEDVDTLAGLILELKGTFPSQKESFIYNSYTLKVEEMNKRRIVKVRYIPASNENN